MSKVNQGKVMSPEACAKMSLAAKGRKASPETRAKMSETRKGRISSVEARTKIGNAHRGKVMSPESRAKMSLAKGKPVVIDGKLFPSSMAVARYYGISYKAAKRRAKLARLNPPVDKPLSVS